MDPQALYLLVHAHSSACNLRGANWQGDAASAVTPSPVFVFDIGGFTVSYLSQILRMGGFLFLTSSMFQTGRSPVCSAMPRFFSMVRSTATAH